MIVAVPDKYKLGKFIRSTIPSEDCFALFRGQRLPRQLVSSWVNHRRPLGRPLLNYGQSLDKDLHRVGFGAGDNWSEIAQDKNRWAKKIKAGSVSGRLADIQKKQIDSVARERAKQVSRAAAVHLEARRLARAQQVAGP